MRPRLLIVLSILLAVVGWWSLYVLTGSTRPEMPGALSLFLAMLFLAVTGTVAPAAAYLNRRLAPAATSRDPWRFLRHSAWAGVCLAVYAWLQVHRALNVGYALVIALIFVAFEVLIVRLRSET
ncbi:MAG: hypothetical protein PHY79_07650 [Anaerolineae bacterium]|nr:hypothetical protein [Anaerolineae bacterium]